MRRLFWVAVGAAAGVYAARKVQTMLHSYSPSGMAERAGGVGDSLRGFADEVRDRMADREAELRAALGIDAGSEARPELDPVQAADLLDAPASRRTRSPRGAP